MLILEKGFFMLKEIKRKTASEAAIEALRNFIIDKKLGPGDKLPPELELAAVLNVSRSVIREAIAHFRTLGIIETKPKTGMKIKELIPESPFSTYFPYIKDNETLVNELFQIRLIIENGMAPFIIQNASAKDIQILEEIALGMNTVNYNKRIELDQKFHMKLLDICGNSMLKKIYPLLDYFKMRMTIKKEEEKNGMAAEISRKHIAIVDAIRKKDADSLRQMLFSKHYRNCLPYIAK